MLLVIAMVMVGGIPQLTDASVECCPEPPRILEAPPKPPWLEDSLEGCPSPDIVIMPDTSSTKHWLTTKSDIGGWPTASPGMPNSTTSTIKDVTMKNETEKIKLGNSLENPASATVVLTLTACAVIILLIFITLGLIYHWYKKTHKSLQIKPGSLPPESNYLYNYHMRGREYHPRAVDRYSGGYHPRPEDRYSQLSNRISVGEQSALVKNEAGLRRSEYLSVFNRDARDRLSFGSSSSGIGTSNSEGQEDDETWPRPSSKNQPVSGQDDVYTWSPHPSPNKQPITAQKLPPINPTIPTTLSGDPSILLDPLFLDRTERKLEARPLRTKRRRRRTRENYYSEDPTSKNVEMKYVKHSDTDNTMTLDPVYVKREKTRESEA